MSTALLVMVGVAAGFVLGNWAARADLLDRVDHVIAAAHASHDIAIRVLGACAHLAKQPCQHCGATRPEIMAVVESAAEEADAGMDATR